MKHKTNQQQQQLLKIQTGRRQTSWLLTIAAEKLNQGLPESRVLNPGFPDFKESVQTKRLHCLHCLLQMSFRFVLLLAFSVFPTEHSFKIF